MPSRGYADSEEKFEAVLDEISELIEKYSGTHDILLAGDMNASMSRIQPQARDRKLCELLNTFGLETQQNPQLNTFHHENGKDKSAIDYIFIKPSTSIVIEDTKTHDMDPVNTSDHAPVGVRVKHVRRQKGSGKEKQQQASTSTKVIWEKCNTEVYKQSILEGLQSMPKLGETEFESLWAITHLNDILLRASDEACGPKPRQHKKSKGGIRPWNPRISSAIAASKKAHREWKRAGSPKNPNHPTVLQRKLAKKAIRKEINAANWKKTNSLQQEIDTASSGDVKLFHKLIRKQRQTTTSRITELCVNEAILTTPEEICEGFGTHFAGLAEPQDRPAFNSEYKQQVEFDSLVIRELCSTHPSKIRPASIEEIKAAIMKLNSNKAADNSGVTAEHLKHACDILTPTMTSIINHLLEKKIVPSVLKDGTLTPIEKKGKDRSIPGNHRGITVLATIEKVLEQICANRLCETLDSTQNRMQRGFTENTSSINAALLVTEAINESIDKRHALKFTTLDATKAFDVVSHDSLFRKLYLDGVAGDLLLLLFEMYRDPETKVKWQGNISKPFTILQGVRQGSPLSTILYKRYVNRLLDCLQNSGLGFSWGSIACPAPTCADDVALLSRNSCQQQAMLLSVNHYTQKERYEINASKSATLTYLPGKKKTDDSTELNLQLAGETIPSQATATHLGIVRQSDNRYDITLDDNIKKGRKTLYALMGAGLHGKNGLNPATSLNILYAYVAPRCLYGLEAVQLNKTQLKKLDNFHRKLLRQLQSLPDSPTVADVAVYALVGRIPLSAEIDKRKLSLFGNIARQQESIENKLAHRQLAIKPNSSKSWFVDVNEILHKYELPSAHCLLADPPTKMTWKKRVCEKVQSYWQTQWIETHSKKPSLKYLNIAGCKVGQIHQVWRTTSHNSRDIRRATIKAKLLTGTYVLQANRAVFNQYSVNGTCPLCKKGIETREHFLVECESTEDIRAQYVARIKILLQASSLEIPTPSENKHWWTQLILDCSHPDIQGVVQLQKEEQNQLEIVTRCLCFALHSARSDYVF
jgi:hypothetical protein